MHVELSVSTTLYKQYKHSINNAGCGVGFKMYTTRRSPHFLHKPILFQVDRLNDNYNRYSFRELKGMI